MSVRDMMGWSLLWSVFIVGCTAAGYAQTGTIIGLTGGLAAGCLIPFAVVALFWFGVF